MAIDILTANDLPGRYPASWYVDSMPPPHEFQALKGVERTEICVIGAGFTGISAALHLAVAGRDVVVLEANRIGWGASGRNGGQVSSGQRIDQAAIEKMVGRDEARWLWRMGENAKTLVRDLTRRYGIECEIEPGIIHADHQRRFLGESRDYVRLLNEEYGYDHIRFLDCDAMRTLVASPDYHGGTHDSGGFHLHPLKYVTGLARAAANAGARIYEHSRVTHWSDEGGIEVRTEKGSVSADHVLFACNGYLGPLESHTAARVMPINNYIIATESLGKEGAAGLIADNSAVADSRFVVNYFRRTCDDRLLFGGGESYSYRFPADIAAFVKTRMLKIFPQLAQVRIDYAWGGTLAITRNRLPQYLQLGKRSWSVSGYSGHGVSTATLAGRLVADAIIGRTGEFERMQRFCAARFPGGTLLRAPLLALAMHWYAMRDRF